MIQQIAEGPASVLRPRYLLLLACLTLAPLSTVAAESYDLVINQGRVIDPESGLDGIRSLGIRSGKIVAISETPLEGPEEINAHGLVVAPGFINLHSHAIAEPGYRLELLDGVTTVLELEAGSFPANRFGRQLGDRPLTHFGASVGHAWIRMRVIDPEGLAELSRTGKLDMSAPAFTRRADEAQRAQMKSLLEAELEAGGLGIGLLLDYMTTAVDEAELHMVFGVAATHQVPVFVHVRRGIAGDPAGLEEVIAMAETTGTSVHICHLNASAMNGVEDWLTKIDAARARGLDITSEMYPWTAGSAAISADVFSRDWRTIFAIEYTDVQWAETGEWLTEERFKRYREERPDGQTMHHYIKEDWNIQTLSRPYVVIASDAMPLTSYKRKVVPNGAGSSTQLLGRYVRDLGVLTMTDALARLSWLPATRLESFAPAFRNKGRIREGADADLVLFDPDTVAARATYLDPFQPPIGIHSVWVAGKQSVHQGQLLNDPGVGTRLSRLADSTLEARCDTNCEVSRAQESR